jgi:hypothetical protein
MARKITEKGLEKYVGTQVRVGDTAERINTRRTIQGELMHSNNEWHVYYNEQANTYPIINGDFINVRHTVPPASRATLVDDGVRILTFQIALSYQEGTGE